jgi:hypothetical protein
MMAMSFNPGTALTKGAWKTLPPSPYPMTPTPISRVAI